MLTDASTNASVKGDGDKVNTFVPPGQTRTLTLKLTPGHYVLLCNLPAHYKAGQHADFTVR